MRLAARTLVFVVAGAMALPVVIGARSTPTTARSETRIQLADLLLGDQRYLEAILVYDQAKEGATQEQRVRASTGLLEALVRVADFTRALQEAEYLRELAPQDPKALALNGDAWWAAGLFDEAEQVYRDVLAIDPESGGARNGLAKSLATRHQHDEALDWAEAALEVSPDRRCLSPHARVYLPADASVSRGGRRLRPLCGFACHAHQHREGDLGARRGQAPAVVWCPAGDPDRGPAGSVAHDPVPAGSRQGDRARAGERTAGRGLRPGHGSRADHVVAGASLAGSVCSR